MGAIIPEAYLDLFDKPAFGHLATLMKDGSPQVTPVWVDYDGRYVRFNSALGRVKDRNVRRDPRVAISIQDPANPYRYLRYAAGSSQSPRKALTTTSTGWPQNTSVRRNTPTDRLTTCGCSTRSNHKVSTRWGKLGRMAVLRSVSVVQCPPRRRLRSRQTARGTPTSFTLTAL